LALFEIDAPYRIIGKEKKKYCDHPVDPLVSKVLRGTSTPMLPYPVVDPALVEDIIEIRKFRQRIFVAALPIQQGLKTEPVRQSSSLII
jgi:hypothetical protein